MNAEVCDNLTGHWISRHSLSRRIGMILALVVLITVGLFLSVWRPALDTNLERFGRQETEMQLTLLGQALLPFVLQNQFAGIYETLDEISKHATTWRSIELLDMQGNRIYPLSAPTTATVPEAIITHPLTHQGVPVATLVVGTDYSAIQLAIGNSVTRLGLGGLLIFLLAALGIAGLVEVFIARRARALADASCRMAQGDYDVQIAIESQDELGLLARSFDAMQKSIRANTGALIAAREKADAANEAKTRFLATMSHEIRTPMNGVMSAASLLHDTPLDPKQQLLVDTLQNSGKNLLQIINDILDFSRLEADKIDLDNEAFSLAAVVDDTVGALAPHAAASGNRLRTTGPAGRQLMLLGDPRRLTQVLTNIIGNAIKFTSNGDIHVQVESAAVDGDSQRVTIRVTDTGIGVPEDNIDALFERFTQSDTSLTRQFEGSGLGLAICKNIIALMGGEIGCRKNAGPGSTFWFALTFPVAGTDTGPSRNPLSARPGNAADPLTRTACDRERNPEHRKLLPSQAADPPPPPPSTNSATDSSRAAHAGPITILVVEDNAVNQMLIRMMLERHDHRVDVVSDGSEAIEALRSQRYDLVLMDMQMPEMSGVEATQHIRELPGAAGSVPIVAVTANVLSNDRERCLEAGMNGYISKPVNLQALEQAVNLARSAA